MDFIIKNKLTEKVKKIRQEKINTALQEQINHLQSELNVLENKYKALQLEVRGA